MANPTKTIRADVESLFSDEQATPRDVALHLLNSWIANLQATETRIDREIFAMLTIFAAFLALDTGILTKLSFQGADLQRTGLVLSIVPIALSYLYYRYSSQVSFVHDLRTAVAFLYKKLHEPVYYGGLDLFVHVPTVRNLESYDSLRAPDRMQRFHDRTTDAVTIILFLGPLLGLGYCLFRLWHYPDLSLVTWIMTVVVSIVFIVRALLFGLKSENDDGFSTRKKPAV